MSPIKTLMVAAALSTSALAFSLPASATEYVIDTKGAHAFINFKISHLGYSWVHGNFEDFTGSFTFDKDSPSKSKVDVTIKTASVNSSHAERDKHLRGNDFLHTSKFPEARFVSTRIEDKSNKQAIIHGDLTLKGITKPVAINAVKIGEGKDPWGGYRAGFSGTASISLADFKMMNLGPVSADVYLTLDIEGVRQ